MLLLACSKHGGTAPANDDGGNATPVKIAAVARATMQVLVSAPGHTDAIEQQKVRSPFDAMLVDLSVENGDKVKTGQLLGHVVSQNSQAALVGARAMLQSARTPAQKQDAARAVTLAERAIVKAPLRAPEAGVVVAHGADEGALVTTHEDIVSLAAADSIVFVGAVVQNDLLRIRAGQRALIRLSAVKEPIDGVVHVILPAASEKDLSSLVRIDFAPQKAPTAIGLFGTAQIVVAEHTNARVIPAAALLRDDVSGVSRVATVGADGKAHWLPVTPGIEQDGRIELVAPPLPDEARVIVSGQIGLPDGAPVRPE
ncbi:MAG: efflux RND transporter periplasmic adaptor subunit [Myxococcales bacterium]|nr:efflux RND transporter periplasmic adaptor subunit [Myxococcales bacterium]